MLLLLRLVGRLTVFAATPEACNVALELAMKAPLLSVGPENMADDEHVIAAGYQRWLIPVLRATHHCCLVC
jgi:hypothetical protein